MFDFSKLMALSEATTGFEGGTLVDEMPSYTLAECMDTLPMVIMESQLEQYDIVEKQNEIMKIKNYLIKLIKIYFFYNLSIGVS